jgi:hypothetical protein
VPVILSLGLKWCVHKPIRPLDFTGVDLSQAPRNWDEAVSVHVKLLDCAWASWLDIAQILHAWRSGLVRWTPSVTVPPPLLRLCLIASLILLAYCHSFSCFGLWATFISLQGHVSESTQLQDSTSCLCRSASNPSILWSFPLYYWWGSGLFPRSWLHNGLYPLAF